MQFKDFDLAQEVLDGLRDVGFENATPIQEQCIPAILQGKDVLASAQTGTGKTAAFAIPVLDHIFKKPKDGIQALVLTPTRELAKQVDEQFWSMGYHSGVTTATVHGGDDWSRQSKALHKGVNVIVATPGRLLDQMKVKKIDFSNIDFLILDEADRMLDMGFIPDVQKIISWLPEKRQNLLFSATMPPKIEQLVNKMMKSPHRVALATNKPAEGITQVVYNVHERDKLPLTLHLYEKMNWTSAIIFTATKRNADVLARELKKKGASVTSIHGDRSQEEREAALSSFRKGEFKIIVATDVISRGIDIEDVSHVVNYTVPRDVEDYVHRVGRTARAKSKGDAITFVSGADRRFIAAIYKELGDKITPMDLPKELNVTSDDKNDDGPKRPVRKSSQKPGRRKPKVDAPKPPKKEDVKADASKGSADADQSQKSDKPDAPVRKKQNRRHPNRNQKSDSGSTSDSGQDDKRSDSGRRNQQNNRRNQRGGRRSGSSRNSDQKGSKEDSQAKTRELIEKVQAPNMKKIEQKIEKAQSKKKNIWGFVKKIFNTEK